MTLYEWLLFLHVLAAFAMIASSVVFTIVAVALRRTERPGSALLLFDVARPAGVLVVVGGLGTLVLGIWLAIYLKGYELWDGWIAGALVLWLVTGGTGGRVGKYFTAVRKDAEALVERGELEPNDQLAAALRAGTPVALHAVSVVALLGILLLMIFKPGA